MNRKADHAVLSLCIVIAFGTAAKARAECSLSCNKATDHMITGSDWSGNDTIRIGIMGDQSGFSPVACRWHPESSLWIVEGLGPRLYPTPVVTVDTSICTGAGNDHIRLAPVPLGGENPINCIVPPFGQTFNLLPFIVGSGARLWISSEGGKDNVSAANLIPLDGGADICGGNENDVLFGSVVGDYINGSNGNDYIDGAEGYDNLKASNGKDVLRVRSLDGQLEDKLRGEADPDCFWLNYPIAAGSTCGPDTGDRFTAAPGIIVPLDCEQPVSAATCCSMTGAPCPATE
jgi:hypothetical protein